MAVDADVEHEQDQAHRDVRENEGILAAVQHVRHGARQRRDGEHPEQREEPVDQVVRVETGRVEGEAGPGPADGQEQREETSEARRGWVGAEGRNDLGDGGDEDQVEEQLEPGRAAVLVGFERAEPRRLEKRARLAKRR